MSQFHIRLIGAVSFVLGIAFQSTRFLAEQAWKTQPSFALSYSVHPYFIYGAFAIQLGLQLLWLLKRSPRIQLKDEASGQMFDVEGFRIKELSAVGNCSGNSGLLTFDDRNSYMPVYIFTNNCLILWTIAFQCKLLVPAIVILSVAAGMQYITILFTNESRSASGDYLTPAIAKVNTAYTILLLAKTRATYEGTYTPPTLQLITYGAVFLLLVVASGIDTIFSIAIIYVLAALYHGSTLNPLWHNTFYWTAAVIAVVVTVNFLIHNVHEKDEQDHLAADFEHCVLFSSDKAQFQVSENLSGVPELPSHASILLARPGGTSRLTRDASVGDEIYVESDYLSYAFHV